MRTILLTLLSGLAALGAGLASANWVLLEGFGFQQKSHGPWSGWVHATSPNADPYTRAHFGRNGELPPPPLEGLVFYADEDNAGDPLRAQCHYQIIGDFPPARHWTLTVFDSAGKPVTNPSGRNAFSNGNVMYSSNGSVTIDLAAEPKPGNWIPLAAAGEHNLALAIYDTPLATEAFLTDTILPRIINLGCTS